MNPEIKPENREPQQKGPAEILWVVLLAGIICSGLLLAKGVFSDSLVSDTASGVSSHSDNIPEAKRTEIEAAFMKYTAKPETVDANNPEVRAQLMRASYLKDGVAEQLIHATQDGKTQIGIISLWDNFDEDGDVVQINTNGLNMTVSIFHAPQTFYVPFQRGEPIQITGIRDGGGGITAAISTASGAVPLPIMAVGQTIVIPNF